MPFLPAAGVTVTYNGFAWNTSTRTKIETRMVYDSANRSVAHNLYRLQLSTYIVESAPGVGCDAQIQDMRARLTRPGQQLVVSGTGFGGNFSINTANVRDVSWGPRPIRLTLEPVGSKAAWFASWECEVALPDCTNAVYQNAIMEANYEVTYTIDGDGRTVRVISGYATIPMTRIAGGQVIPDTIDNYREQVASIPRVPGFRRGPQVFNISSDQRRIDFSITDTELETDGLPWGCTDADGSVRVSTSGSGLSLYTMTIQAQYTVGKDRSRSDALLAFFELYRDRINTTIQRRGRTANDGTPIVTPFGFEAEEGLYRSARTVSFKLTVLITSSIEEILGDAGFFRAVPRTNATVWQTTMERAQGVRGHAGLRSLASENVLIDLCSSPQQYRSLTTQERSLSGEREVEGLPTPPSPGALDVKISMDVTLKPGTMITQTLKAQGSSLSGQKDVVIGGSLQSADDGPILPSSGTPTSTSGLSDVTVAAIGAVGNPPKRPVADVTPANYGAAVQDRTDGVIRIRLHGYAVTLWGPIPCPQLLRIGNYTLVPENTHAYKTRFIGVLGPNPVYATIWDLTYRIVLRNEEKSNFKAPKLNRKNTRVKDYIPPSGGFTEAQITELRKRFKDVFSDP